MRICSTWIHLFSRHLGCIILRQWKYMQHTHHMDQLWWFQPKKIQAALRESRIMRLSIENVSGRTLWCHNNVNIWKLCLDFQASLHDASGQRGARSSKQRGQCHRLREAAERTYLTSRNKCANTRTNTKIKRITKINTNTKTKTKRKYKDTAFEKLQKRCTSQVGTKAQIQIQIQERPRSYREDRPPHK